MATPYRFRLETVLKLRKRREREQQRVVAERIGKITEARRRIEQIGRQMIQSVDAARGAREAGPLNLEALAAQRFWIGQLQRQLLAERTGMNEIDRSLSVARQRLAVLARDRKALEKLRDKQARKHAEAQARAERAELDELATQAAARNIRNANGTLG